MILLSLEHDSSLFRTWFFSL